MTRKASPSFLLALDVHRLKTDCRVSSYMTKKVLDKIIFLCYNMDTLKEDERPLNDI